MKKIIVLLFASLLGFGMTAHAADAATKETARQEQVKKLRVQADKAHKKGDALAAQADKLESESGVKSDEKMRGSRCRSGWSDNNGKTACEWGVPGISK
jgi:cell division protein FtsB